MKFGPMLLYVITNISNIFLTQCWGLETSCRPFNDFNKMTMKRDLSVFRSWYLTFLILLFTLSKNVSLETWHNWLLSNWSRLLNWREPGTYPQSSESLKRSHKNIVLIYLYQLPKFAGLMSCVSKDILKNTPFLMY